MRFFTPERFLRLQNLDSEQGFLAATHEWEQAAEEYTAYLREITPHLLPGIRRLVELPSLHDARVVSIWQGRTRLTIALQLQGETSRLCVLTYSLIDSPYLDPSVLPDEYRSGQATWLYDEIGIDRDTLFDAATGIQYRSGNQTTVNGGQQRGAVVYTQDVLLSNGWELRLRFHQLTITRPTALILARADRCDRSLRHLES